MREIVNRAKSAQILKSLQASSGLFMAARNEKTGYNKAWIRDNIYETLGLEAVKDYDSVLMTIHALFEILKKHEYKIDHAIEKKPDTGFKYIHPRYCPFTLDEYPEPWGFKQNDAIGAFLFKVGDLERKGFTAIRDGEDLRIIQKLVNYLSTIEYWHDSDNGVWESNEEIHASSIGACVAGLISVEKYAMIPEGLVKKGIDALNNLLPHESEMRRADLALLSLIYPFNVASKEQEILILKNVEENLVREKGLIRYKDDWYYANEAGEAEWVMGFPWLAKIYKDLGNKEKYEYYLKKTYECMNEQGELPELYHAQTNIPNENTPLGWSQAMFLVAIA